MARAAPGRRPARARAPERGAARRATVPVSARGARPHRESRRTRERPRPPRVCGSACTRAHPSVRRPHLRAVGMRALRPSPLRHLLRSLHAKVVGSAPEPHLGRLGARAHFAAGPERRPLAPLAHAPNVGAHVREAIPLPAAGNGAALSCHGRRGPRAGWDCARGDPGSGSRGTRRASDGRVRRGRGRHLATHSSWPAPVDAAAPRPRAHAAAQPLRGARRGLCAAALSRARVREFDALADRRVEEHLDVRREPEVDDVAHPGAEASKRIHGSCRTNVPHARGPLRRRRCDVASKRGGAARPHDRRARDARFARRRHPRLVRRARRARVSRLPPRLRAGP